MQFALVLSYTLTVLLLACPALATTADIGPTVAEYVAADSTAPVVTPRNVEASDRFWPFRITLTADWTPPGAEAAIPARPGVLVRVNSDETARVDFASLGLFDVPIGRTDLIAAANRVRLGEETKMAPNLVLTIGNKLIDTTRDRVHVFHIPRDTPIDAILCVFADPNAEPFVDLARQLGRFIRREDLQTVIFPQTDMQDLGSWKRFRKIGLRAPFVRDRYKRPFTRSLLEQEHESRLPYVQLVTREGRILVEGLFAQELLETIEIKLSEIAERHAAR